MKFSSLCSAVSHPQAGQSQTTSHQAEANTIITEPNARGTAGGFKPTEDSDPVTAVGLAARLAVETLALGVLDELATLPVTVVPVVPPLSPKVRALSTLHAPVKVDMTLVFCSAAGVEPQLAACVIQMMLSSRSKTAAPVG